MAPRSPARLSRRRLLAASGVTLAAGAPAVLAACGDAEENDEVSAEREAELLGLILAQQQAVIEALGFTAPKNAPDELRQPLDALAAAREDSAQDLERSIQELGGAPADESVELIGGESPTEGAQRQLEASIAASIESIGELSPEQRKPVQRAITEDAAALAAIRGSLGEEPAPDAFVMGPPAEAAA